LGGDQFDGYDWEYPLFCQFYGKDIRPVHIKVTDNISKEIPVQTNTIDCIVSTTLNSNAINYSGKSFVNQSIGNDRIWIYK
jgi:hypothetical protein